MVDFKRPLWADGRPAFTTGQGDEFSRGYAREVSTAKGTFYYFEKGGALEKAAPRLSNAPPVDWDQPLYVQSSNGAEAEVIVACDDGSYLGEKLYTVRTPSGQDLEFFENGRPRWHRWGITNTPFHREPDEDDPFLARQRENEQRAKEASDRVAARIAAAQAEAERERIAAELVGDAIADLACF